MTDRGERRRRTRSAVKKRVTTGKVARPWGVSDKEAEQPHRLAKRRVKFTGKGGSLKEEKQKAARAGRRKARMMVQKGEEPQEGPKNSIKWSYW